MPRLCKQDKNIRKNLKDDCKKNFIVICADFDEDCDFNKTLAKYASNNNYILMWMNKDIEDAFFGK